MSLISQGKDYSRLKQSYVIFICTFDPFAGTPAAGSEYYVFENVLRGSGDNVTLGDGTKKVFLNTKGIPGTAGGYCPGISETPLEKSCPCVRCIYLFAKLVFSE